MWWKRTLTETGTLRRNARRNERGRRRGRGRETERETGRRGGRDQEREEEEEEEGEGRGQREKDDAVAAERETEGQQIAMTFLLPTTYSRTSDNGHSK